MINQKQFMHQATITKEEVNQLPIVGFEGEIVLVDNMEKFHQAMKTLKKHKLVGFDTETRPSFRKGESYPISLLQIATEDQCFLFRLNMIQFPEELKKYLSKLSVKKIGLALHDDVIGLQELQQFKARNYTDIQSIVNQYGIMELSLQKVFAILFQGKISKRQRLSNWERNELTDAQMRYAATDAWATLMIYKELQKRKKLSKAEIEAIKQKINPPEEVEDNAEKSNTSPNQTQKKHD